MQGPSHVDRSPRSLRTRGLPVVRIDADCRLKHPTYVRRGGGVRWEDMRRCTIIAISLSWRWAFMAGTITQTLTHIEAQTNRLRHTRHQQTNPRASNATPDHTGTLGDLSSKRVSTTATAKRNTTTHSTADQHTQTTHTAYTHIKKHTHRRRDRTRQVTVTKAGR